ncbi:N-acetylglucosamine kinase [Salininema proteolyticum]|uniref:N-acetylglucosamine kinase n=1 Tax=Salininema proteolyticum TaxID=1607685 RepID=A0ABV8U5D7_9ACTN
MKGNRAFIAIDGGNSKTDVVAATDDGRVHAYVRGGTSSPHRLGYAGSVDYLAKLIETARSEARWDAAKPVERVEALLAGADLPVEIDRLGSDARSRKWARRVRIDNDTFALLRAGTGDRNAVAVVCGAGMNSVGRNDNGDLSRFPALGPTTGDWGGGEDLADSVLYHAVRSEDGRGPSTALAEAVRSRFATASAEEAAIGVHLGEIDRESLHTLVPLLFDAAANGDGVALRIVERQAEEIAAMVRVSARRLGLEGRGFTVVGGGGVLRSRPPVLHDEVRERLSADHPRAEYVSLGCAPVVGAAWSALDALLGRTTGPAHRRLAAETAERVPLPVDY